MNKVFLIGNGESRKDFNLDLLKPHGKIYGCNAIYRQYTPDVLVSVDHGIMHEIYQSGYCYKNETWFRDWTTVPDHMYDSMVYAGLSKIDIEELNKWHIKNENKRTDEKQFVMHGANLSGLVTILKQNKDKFQRRISQYTRRITNPRIKLLFGKFSPTLLYPSQSWSRHIFFHITAVARGAIVFKQSFSKLRVLRMS